MKSKINVFISYAIEDKNIAERIYKDLYCDEINPWIDNKNIIPGQNWKLMINESIKKSDFFIALLSSNSISKRGYVQKEFKLALDLFEEFAPSDVFIIPLRMEACEPIDERLKDIQWIDIFPDYNIGIKKLKESLFAISKKYPKNSLSQGKYKKEVKRKKILILFFILFFLIVILVTYKDMLIINDKPNVSTEEIEIAKNVSNTKSQKQYKKEDLQLFEKIYRLYFLDYKTDEVINLLPTLSKESLNAILTMLKTDERTKDSDLGSLADYRHYNYLITQINDISGNTVYDEVHTGKLTKFLSEYSGASYSCFDFKSDKNELLEVCMKAGITIGIGANLEIGERIRVYLVKSDEFGLLIGKVEKLIY